MDERKSTQLPIRRGEKFREFSQPSSTTRWKFLCPNFSSRFRTCLVVGMIMMRCCLAIGTNPAITHSPDCSANDRLKCRVEEGICAANPQSDDPPSAPHDLRVSPYLITNPTRKPDAFQLWVNVSWRPTYEIDINKTQGFELTVVEKESDRQWCFTFILDDAKWEERDRHESTRFRFSTMDKFDYARAYHFELQSLPKPMNRSSGRAHLSQEITTPGHPEPAEPEEAVINYCSRGHSHPHASRWVAAFRLVYIQPKARSIFVEFIGAPPQYCFEEYELQLIDASKPHVQLIIQHIQISAKDFVHEMHDNVSVAFGNHTFKNVTAGTYDIWLVPMSYSKLDNRCLCPLKNRVCTCSVSIYDYVEMPPAPTMPPPPNPCDLLPPVKFPIGGCPSNGSSPRDNNSESSSRNWIVLVCLIIAALFAIAAIIAILLCYYRRYKRKGAARMYLLPISQTDMETTTNGTLSREMSMVIRPLKLTLIYSHDCPEYERVVRSLVDYLNAQCSCEVRADYLCASDIAANKFDWAYKSIVEADRVVVLNSYGAYVRYQAKLVQNQSTAIGDQQTTTMMAVERADANPYDDLFLLQLDLSSQESRKNQGITKKFVSARFPFTSDEYVLPQANPYIRYELPKHFRSFVIDLHRLALLGGLEDDAENETSMPAQLKRVNKDDYSKSAEGQRLSDSIDTMNRLIRERPDWFESLHIRRTIAVPNTDLSSTSTSWTTTTSNRTPSALSTMTTNPTTSSGVPESISTTIADHRPAAATVRQDESNSPLLEKSIIIHDHHRRAMDGKDFRHNEAMTKNSVDSMDSGVGVSSNNTAKMTNGTSTMVTYSPPKNNYKTAANGKSNGIMGGGGENDQQRQRLIT